MLRCEVIAFYVMKKIHTTNSGEGSSHSHADVDDDLWTRSKGWGIQRVNIIINRKQWEPVSLGGISDKKGGFQSTRPNLCNGHTGNSLTGICRSPSTYGHMSGWVSNLARVHLKVKPCFYIAFSSSPWKQTISFCLVLRVCILSAHNLDIHRIPLDPSVVSRLIFCSDHYFLTFSWVVDLGHLVSLHIKCMTGSSIKYEF